MRSHRLVLVICACLAACGGRVALEEAPDAAATDIVDAAGPATRDAAAAHPMADSGAASTSGAVDSSTPIAVLVDSGAPVTENADATTPSDAPTSDAIAPDPSDAPDLPDVVCDGGAPVAACVEYFAFFAQCFMEPDFIAGACQAALLPQSDADVPAIAEICQENLDRLHQACR